jgi:hypothetical protein
VASWLPPRRRCDPADPGAVSRFTCYYYRGAYYKAFWADPPSCTVGELRRTYRGENSFPLILQNVHRYMLFISAGILLILILDVWKAFWFTDPATGAVSFGVGIGTLVLASNTFLLSGYLFGCHSMRHVVGGCVDQLSRAPLGLRLQTRPQPPLRGGAVVRRHGLLTYGPTRFYGQWSDVRYLAVGSAAGALAATSLRPRFSGRAIGAARQRDRGVSPRRWRNTKSTNMTCS